MKCINCNTKMKEVMVKVHMADSPVLSYQCPKCDYFDFEKKSANKVIKEIRDNESPLRIKQKIVKLSGERLGMYFNKHVVESLKLKKGSHIYVSVPDEKHILLEI